MFQSPWKWHVEIVSLSAVGTQRIWQRQRIIRFAPEAIISNKESVTSPLFA
jgi:hypothetical protein